MRKESIMYKILLPEILKILSKNYSYSVRLALYRSTGEWLLPIPHREINVCIIQSYPQSKMRGSYKIRMFLGLSQCKRMLNLEIYTFARLVCISRDHLALVW